MRAADGAGSLQQLVSTVRQRRARAVHAPFPQSLPVVVVGALYVHAGQVQDRAHTRPVQRRGSAGGDTTRHDAWEAHVRVEELRQVAGHGRRCDRDRGTDHGAQHACACARKARLFSVEGGMDVDSVEGPHDGSWSAATLEAVV